MIDGQNLFDQLVKNDLRAYDNIQKIATGQGDDYTTYCLSDYNYFNRNYKIIAIDLRKQQYSNTAIQQINLTGNVAQDPNTNATMFFIIEESKKAILDFSQATVRALLIYFALR